WLRCCMSARWSVACGSSGHESRCCSSLGTEITAAHVCPAESSLHARTRRLFVGFTGQALPRFPEWDRRECVGTWPSGNTFSPKAASESAYPRFEFVLPRISGRAGETTHKDLWT